MPYVTCQCGKTWVANFKSGILTWINHKQTMG